MPPLPRDFVTWHCGASPGERPPWNPPMPPLPRDFVTWHCGASPGERPPWNPPMPPLPRDFVTWHCGASPGERPPWNPPLAWGGPLEPPRWTVTESTRHCRTSPAYNLLSVEGRQGARPGALGVAAAYVLLFLLGAMEGVIGCFQFSRSIGSFPVAALGFCALILVTCLLAAGAGMDSPMGALVVAAGWLAASFGADPADRRGQRDRYQHHRGQAVPLRRCGLRRDRDRGQFPLAAAPAQW